MALCATQNRTRVEWRGLGVWCDAGLVFFLAGCTFLSLYRYADWIIPERSDHYLHLTSDPRRDLTQRHTPLLARHRQEAIPQYETVLEQSRQRLERGLTNQDIDWVYANYDRLRADLF